MNVDLEPGWLKRQMDDVAALGRAEKKIVAASDRAKRENYTAPVAVEFTIPELHAIARMNRYKVQRHT